MDARQSAIGPPPAPSLRARACLTQPISAMPNGRCLRRFCPPSSTGRPWRWPLRAVFDGILYVLRTGCAWRHLPLDFPPWSTVHRWFLRLSQTGVFERRAHALTMADRERVGREACPTGCVVDAQAARSGGVGVAGERGYDPARRVVGRKRHALTDTDGRLLVAAVSPADLHDSHGAIALLRASRGLFPFLAHCFADRAYVTRDETADQRGHPVEVVGSTGRELVEARVGRRRVPRRSDVGE